MRRRFVGREVRIARLTARFEGRTWVSEDGHGVRPVKKEVEGNANDGGNCAWSPKMSAQDTTRYAPESVLTNPSIEARRDSYSCLHPYRPCTQAINEAQRKVYDDRAAGALASPCPTLSGTIHRGR